MSKGYWYDLSTGKFELLLGDIVLRYTFVINLAILVAMEVTRPPERLVWHMLAVWTAAAFFYWYVRSTDRKIMDEAFDSIGDSDKRRLGVEISYLTHWKLKTITPYNMQYLERCMWLYAIITTVFIGYVLVSQIYVLSHIWILYGMCTTIAVVLPALCVVTRSLVWDRCISRGEIDLNIDVPG